MGARRRISPSSPPGGEPVAACGGPERDLHPVERHPVVDDTRAGLGHAVGGDHVGRQRVGGLAAAEEHAGEDGGIEALQCSGDQGDVGRPSRSARLLDGFGLESRQDQEGRSRDDRPGDHGRGRRCAPAAGRRATSAAPGRRRGAREVATAEAATASWVSTTPLGCPDVPDVATTSASPSSTGIPSRRACCSPSEPTMRVGRSASSMAVRAAGGSRGSRGAAASPVSQMARSASTKPIPPGRSSATSSGTGQ